ncbi:MAG TPA: CHAT domain-containing tetratricopeptide repeat protein [Stellaceae bacterium]|nr:CHAT domain-containing tetratricopeptide repeat protein [Stellaceae bacterium]
MRSGFVRAALVALVVVAASGLARAQQEAAPAAPVVAPVVPGTGNSVGADLDGVACRWEERTDFPAERGAPAPANIFCGDAKQPTGSVSALLAPPSLPTDPAARQPAMERAVGETAVGRDDAGRMSCTKGVWDKLADGADLMLQPCALNDSEWPQVIVVMQIGQLIVRGEGLPAALPALEVAMARLAGKEGAGAVAFATATEPRARLVKLAGDRWLRASSADFAHYGELTETARVEASRKNFSGAEGHYRQALAIIDNVFGDQSPGAGLLLMEVALQISNQERFDEAAALFRRADPIIQANGTAPDRARLLLYQAFDAANRGHFDEALEYAANSAGTWRGIINQGGVNAGELNADLSESPERGELAFSLDLAAEMALRTGNLAAADANASEAAQIITEMTTLPPWWRAEVLTTIGEIRAAQGRPEDADNAFRAALILQERLFGNTAPTAVTYLVFARVFAEERLYEESIRSFRLALKILRDDEVARSEVVVDQITPFVVSANAISRSDPSQRAQLESELFEASQLIGRSLVDDTVNRVAARLAEAAPAIAGLVNDLEQARRERDSARLTLAQEVSLPDDQRGSDRENALMAQINTAAARADALEKRITSEFPDYSKFANPGPVSLQDMQAALNSDEALVLFEVGRERSFVILVRKDGMTARPLTLDSGTMGDAIANLRKAFVVRQGQVDAFDLNRSYTLYRGLFGGIEQGLAGINHLIIVPTGPLASLPLGLLVTKSPAGAPRDYARAEWLLKRTAISEVPSARAFISLRQLSASAPAPRPLLAVANPNFTGGAQRAGQVSSLEALENQCRDEGPVPPQLLRALPPLPDTADEVRKVAAILHADPGSLLTGNEATEPRFRAMPVSDYRVLYFATHGLLPTALRCQSEPALVLSPPAAPQATRASDGVLDASEVAQLRLNADLVVLSACNTATAGGQFGGESLSGLAGAFFHAGARTILASHWEVPSAQTVQLMTGLFQKLGPNFSGGIAESLRQSQLALAAQPQTAHPFFWAAFTLIGDGGVVQAGRNAVSANTAPVASAAAPSPEKQK